MAFIIFILSVVVFNMVILVLFLFQKYCDTMENQLMTRFDNWTEPGRGTRGFPITRPVRTVVRVTTGSQKIKR